MRGRQKRQEYTEYVHSLKTVPASDPRFTGFKQPLPCPVDLTAGGEPEWIRVGSFELEASLDNGTDEDNMALALAAIIKQKKKDEDLAEAFSTMQGWAQRLLRYGLYKADPLPVNPRYWVPESSKITGGTVNTLHFTLVRLLELLHLSLIKCSPCFRIRLRKSPHFSPLTQPL